MISRPTRIWNGPGPCGANSKTCVAARTKPALPKGMTRSTRYTLTATACVAETIGRIPTGCRPRAWATVGEMHVLEAPVSSNAGKAVMVDGGGELAANVPAFATPTLTSAPGTGRH